MRGQMNGFPHSRGIESRVEVSVGWQVKERQNGVWEVVKEFHNLLTNFGLTAYAAAPSGQYTPPIYMVIDTASTTMYATGNVGDATIQVTGNPTLGGDTQLVLSVGLAAQETVTFTNVTGSNPAIFTLSAPLVNAHPANDPVVRGVTAGDTMSSVISEGQYDPNFNAGNRLAMTAGFSPGLGQNTMQFFMSGSTATNLFFAHVGLADQLVIGNLSTNLHNYAALGYNHNSTSDLEIDVTYTLQTF